MSIIHYSPNDTQAFIFEETLDDVWLRRVIYYIRMCFVPVILVGTATNVMNFFVLSQKEMRCLSTSVYLLALALADLGKSFILAYLFIVNHFYYLLIK